MAQCMEVGNHLRWGSHVNAHVVSVVCGKTRAQRLETLRKLGAAALALGCGRSVLYVYTGRRLHVQNGRNGGRTFWLSNSAYCKQGKVIAGMGFIAPYLCMISVRTAWQRMWLTMLTRDSAYVEPAGRGGDCDTPMRLQAGG